MDSSRLNKQVSFTTEKTLVTEEQGIMKKESMNLQNEIKQIRFKEQQWWDPKKRHEIMLKSQKLYQLIFLEDFPDINPELITSADLSNNFISNIDVMAMYPNLISIDASDNYISSINFKLPRLQKLILRNNFLEQIPNLSQFQVLQELDLSTNNLTSFRLQIQEENFLNLTKINLNNNKIDFTIDKGGLAEFIGKLKKMKSLTTLNIENNKFNQNIINMLISQLDNKFTNLNGRDKSYYKNTINQQISMSKKEEQFQEEETTQDYVPNKQQRKAKNTIPSLQQLYHNLDQAICHPTLELEYLQNLFSDSEVIAQVADSDKLDENFSRNLDEHQCKNMIEKFMQNAMLIVDNHFELRKIMLSILCKLTIIKAHDFGRFCFAALKDLMVAGEDLEERVMEKIKEEVILKLEHSSGQDKTPMGLLIGLKDLVIQSNKPKILESLFKDYFGKNLKDLKQNIERGKQYNMVFGNHGYYDAIISLLAASIQQCEKNVRELKKQELQYQISDIFQNTSPTHDRYLDLLTIIKEICNKKPLNDEELNLSNFFIKKYVHKTIVHELKVTYYNYKKNNDLTILVNQQETVEQRNVRYKIFAGQIDCLANLLNAERNEIGKMLDDEKSILYDLINIVSNFKTDPKILTAVCNLTLQILQQVKDSNFLEICIQKIQSCTPLIGYLGMSKYEDLVKSSRKYHLKGQENEEKDVQNALVYMDDPIVHNLFISIIKLFSFFSIEEQKLEQKKDLDEDQTKKMKLIQVVNGKLNSNNREDALFKILQVPSDEVKLEVVKCLYTIPLKEFEQNEITQMIDLLSIQNIGAGITEIIFSFIFWIMSKMMIEKNENIECVQIFKLKCSNMAISKGLSILIKNTQRKINSEDLEEKNQQYTLNLSILTFLKHCSFCPKSSPHLKGKEKYLTEFLVLEQNCCGSQDKIPVDLENTQLASKFEFLKNAINKLEPYNYVSFRVLVRIANLLMGISGENPDVDYSRPWEDIQKRLFEDQKQALKKMIKQERQLWVENPIKKESNFNQEHQREHSEFQTNNGPEILRMFLLKADQEGLSQWMYNNQDPEIERIISNQTRIKNLEKFLKKNGITITEEEAELISNPQQRMREEFKNQDLGHGYNISNLEKNQVKQKTIQINYLQKKSGIQNDKMRILCIAAFLRCLHAALDYSGIMEQQTSLIDGLRDLSVFRSITQLCHTTNWFEANIGTKYLRVFINVLKLDFSKGEESTDNLKKYQIFSTVVQNILTQLKNKIKQESESQKLNSDERALISKVAEVSFEMCYQCSLFPTIEPTNVFYLQKATRPCQMYNHILTLEKQKKLIGLLVDHLFPLTFTKILLKIILEDMREAAELSSRSGERDLEEQDGQDQETQLRIRNRTREFIKRFMAEYLGSSITNKYKILEQIIRRVVFSEHKLRTSFIEELLGTCSYALMHQYFIKFIHSEFWKQPTLLQDPTTIQRSQTMQNPQELQKVKNRLIIAITKPQKEKERVILSAIVRTSQSPLLFDYTQNVIMATNYGIYFVKDSVQDPCKDCPHGSNCFGIPQVRTFFSYSDIKKILCFEQFRQMIMIEYFSERNWEEQGQTDGGGLFESTPGHTSGVKRQQQVWMIIHKKTDGEILRQILRNSKIVTKQDAFFITALKEGIFEGATNDPKAQLPNLDPKYLEYCYQLQDITQIADEKRRNLVVLAITENQVVCFKLDMKRKFIYQEKERDKILKQYQDMMDLLKKKTASGGTTGGKKWEDGNDAKTKLQQCVRKIWQFKIGDLSSLSVELDKNPAVTIENQDGEKFCISFLSDLGRVEFVDTVLAIHNSQQQSNDND